MAFVSSKVQRTLSQESFIPFPLRTDLYWEKNDVFSSLRSQQVLASAMVWHRRVDALQSVLIASLPQTPTLIMHRNTMIYSATRNRELRCLVD